MAFPENDMLGIDVVIPDVTYLKDNIDKVKGKERLPMDIRRPYRCASVYPQGAECAALCDEV